MRETLLPPGRPLSWPVRPSSHSPTTRPPSQPCVPPAKLPRPHRHASRPIDRQRRVDTSALIDSLHPLEMKVLTAFGSGPAGGKRSTEELASATGLDLSQLSMAIEWLLAKQLLIVDAETVTPVVSLTSIGATYFEQASPIERILAAA